MDTLITDQDMTEESGSKMIQELHAMDDARISIQEAKDQWNTLSINEKKAVVLGYRQIKQF